MKEKKGKRLQLQGKINYVYLFILISLSLLTILLFFKFSTEDSFITYRYAKNLIDGHGFVYNQNEPFLGTTAPFYALILAFFGLLGFNIPYFSGCLSVFSLGMSLVIIYFLTLKKGYPLVGFLGGLFVLLNPWILMTFGSETYFQLLMVTSAFYFYDQEKYTATTIFCGLAFLVRPDGITPGLIILIDYMIKNRKVPFKEVALFLILCIPPFLFYYFTFNTFLPGTLEAKQAQYASGLWRGFLPGTLNFIDLLLKENRLLISFGPLLIIGGLTLLFSGKLWLLIAAWAAAHTLGYMFLKVSFYHWYAIPLIFLLMLISAFSVNFIKAVLSYFRESKKKIWEKIVFNQKISISISQIKSSGVGLKWGSRILAAFITGCIIVALAGGIKSYHDKYKILPFPKLELYTEAGKWMAEHTEPEASVAFLEVGYFGYYSQRKIIDLVGLITPGVPSHIRRRDFQWAVDFYRPDYFIYNSEFSNWLKQIIEQPWFKKEYKKIKEMSHPSYPFILTVFKRDANSEDSSRLVIDSWQNESNIPVGEIIGKVEVGQTFYCFQNNLTRIDVMLATYNRKNHQDVIFHLKESPSDSQDIYTEKFNAAEITDNSYRSFEFPPILDSKGKTYYFCFESPRSKKGDAITIWSCSTNCYPKGALYLNRKEEAGDLRFKTFCKVYFKEKHGSILNQDLKFH